MKLEYKVETEKYSNIKEILRAEFHISERLIVKLKQNHGILLNGLPVFVNTPVQIGDTLNINMDFQEESDNIVPKEMPLEILYEDEFLLILNKPAMLAIHPSIIHYEDSLSNGVKFYFEKNNLKIKIRPVNRLDKDTSGIVIFAKHAYIQECLIRQMKENTFSKKYLALVEGFFEPEKGTINAPITRKENSIIERKIDLNSNLESEQAITHYKTLEKLNNASLVEFSLETGRTHQIRVHSKFKNHPLIGDSLYGNKSDLISRQALHAYKISFIHPISKTTINIEAPIPKDFENAYNLLVIEQKRNI